MGWLLARQGAAALANVFIEESWQRQEIVAGQLIIHADRGPSMTSKPVPKRKLLTPADLPALGAGGLPVVASATAVAMALCS